MSRFVIDIEANSLDPDKIWVIYIKDIDTNEVYDWNIESNFPTKPELFLKLFVSEPTELIGHNVINYDLPVLRKLLGWTPPATCRITDTLVLSRLFKPDREGGHSLREWGERLGYSKGDVTDFSVFTSEMVAYCRNDVELTAHLFKELEREAGDYDWSEAITLEHDIARIMTEQEQNGFAFDVTMARELLDRIGSYLRDLNGRIQFPSYSKIRHTGDVTEPFKIDGTLKLLVSKYLDVDGTDDIVAGPFSKISIEEYNNDSNPQLKEWLLSNGWEPDQYTPKGAPKITEASLRKMGGVGEALAERGVWVHRQRLVKGLLDNVGEDGRISGGANTIGTPTGRMRHARIVNIPGNKSTLGKEIRALFTAGRDNVLVGYDAEQLELRVLAHYIGNPEYVEVITDADPHVFAQQAAGLPDRNAGKTLNYALIYGAGPEKLGELVGGGKREGSIIRDRLYASIPGLKALVKRVNTASKKGYLRGLDGRKLWIRAEHKALNTLIQGGGAICMKKVAQIVDVHADHSRAIKVCDMHDEAQWEVEPSYVETFTELVHESFVETTRHFGLRCPMAAEVKPGNNWSQTH